MRETRRTHMSEYKYIHGFGGEKQVKRSLRSRRRTEEDNIKMDLKEMG